MALRKISWFPEPSICDSPGFTGKPTALPLRGVGGFIDVAQVDFAAVRILYAIDWDGQGRSETIQGQG